MTTEGIFCVCLASVLTAGILMGGHVLRSVVCQGEVDEDEIAARVREDVRRAEVERLAKLHASFIRGGLKDIESMVTAIRNEVDGLVRDIEVKSREPHP